MVIAAHEFIALLCSLNMVFSRREAGLELREDVDTVLQPGMVVSMEPMLTLPEGCAGSGGYREHDILIVQEDGAEDITRFPYGPEHNIV